MRIVVADDELDMRDYLRTILQHWGHEVLAIAENGRELVEECRTHAPDLIITDVRMPDMNGDEAVREIWSFSATPVVLVSAYQCPDEFDPSSNKPPFRYLNKPINRTLLKAALDSLPIT